MSEQPRTQQHLHTKDHSPWAVFLIFLRLGLTAFGGPVAHLGYFREEFVTRRRWLTERGYADLVALCQFLPGPASSQVGMALGFARSGYAGALAAWAGFTLPSALMLLALALGVSHLGQSLPVGLLHGLKVVTVAVVAQAVWGMARHLCPDRARIALMLASAGALLLTPSVWAQIGVIALAGIAGLLWFRPHASHAHEPLPMAMRRRTGVLWLMLFVALLLGLPLLSAVVSSPTLSIVDAFYRAGSLVFGGGHVVLPLLQAEVVSTGWVSPEVFVAGYGAAQAVPGPLFTFAAFLGASMHTAPSAWMGGLIALMAIFVPAFLLVLGALPFWESLRRHTRTQAALMGVNAAVVGVLLTALYHPVGTSAIHAPADVVFALATLVALMRWKWPPWLVVVCSAAAGWWLYA